MGSEKSSFLGPPARPPPKYVRPTSNLPGYKKAFGGPDFGPPPGFNQALLRGGGPRRQAKNQTLWPPDDKLPDAQNNHLILCLLIFVFLSFWFRVHRRFSRGFYADAVK